MVQRYRITVAQVGDKKAEENTKKRARPAWGDSLLRMFLGTPNVQLSSTQILSWGTLELSVLFSVDHLRLHLSGFVRVYSFIPPARVIVSTYTRSRTPPASSQLSTWPAAELIAAA